MTQSLIIDTDIGDDIDDAVALTLLLEAQTRASSPEFTTELISTVHGEVNLRAALAEKLVRNFTLGAKVPVVSGLGQPLKQAPRLGFIQPQAQILSSEERNRPLDTDGIARMHECLMQAQSKVTLICLGPLTNVASLLTRFPACAQRIERILAMGASLGSWRAQGTASPGNEAFPEYNIQMDPEAAQMVFQSGLELYLFPFEIGHRLTMPTELVQRLKNSDRESSALLGKLIALWEPHTSASTPILYDPAVIGYLLEPSSFQFKTVRVEVVVAAGSLRGVTCMDDDPQGTVHLCHDMDEAKFYLLLNKFLWA